MLIALTTYPNKPRELKKFVTWLIKGSLVACVSRIQYVKSYYMQEGKMMNEEEKILLIKLPVTKKTQFEMYFYKHHPYDIPELIYLSPLEVSEKYLQRVTWLVPKS